MRELNLKFPNRAEPISHSDEEIINLKEKRYVRDATPFLDEIPGLGIIKLLGLDT